MSESIDPPVDIFASFIASDNENCNAFSSFLRINLANEKISVISLNGDCKAGGILHLREDEIISKTGGCEMHYLEPKGKFSS